MEKPEHMDKEYSGIFTILQNGVKVGEILAFVSTLAEVRWQVEHSGKYQGRIVILPPNRNRLPIDPDRI